MKSVLAGVVAAAMLAACATSGVGPGGPGTAAAPINDASSALPDPSNAATPAGQDMSPRIILPVTGGPPVIGIPLGGELFLPVTGGTPVIGISTSP